MMIDILYAHNLQNLQLYKNSLFLFVVARPRSLLSSSFSLACLLLVLLSLFLFFLSSLSPSPMHISAMVPTMANQAHVKYHAPLYNNQVHIVHPCPTLDHLSV